MRTLQRAAVRARHVLPTSARQEPVVAARDEFCAVSESDAICRLNRPPVVAHGRLDIPSIPAALLRADDAFADVQMSYWLRPAVCQQDSCIAAYTECTGMSTSPVRIDRPPERHLALFGHAIDHGLRAHLVETRVQR